jgi:hypothetical protein
MCNFFFFTSSFLVDLVFALRHMQGCNLRCAMLDEMHNGCVGIYLDKFLQYSTFDTSQAHITSTSTGTHHSSIIMHLTSPKSAVTYMQLLHYLAYSYPYPYFHILPTQQPNSYPSASIIPSIYTCQLKSTFIRKPRITKKFDRGVSSMFRPVVKKQVRKRTSRRKTWS